MPASSSDLGRLTFPAGNIGLNPIAGTCPTITVGFSCFWRFTMSYLVTFSEFYGPTKLESYETYDEAYRRYLDLKDKDPTLFVNLWEKKNTD